MSRMKLLSTAILVSVAVGFSAAQAPEQPAGGQGRGGGRGAPGGAPGAQAGAPPARGITVNLNAVQKATASITGANGIKGTAELNEFQVANGGLIQVVLNVEGLPPGMHGVQIHAVGKCDGPDFASSGGHFDPGPAGNTDVDLNHPFHAGDLPNVTAGATGTVNATVYTTRFNLGGPLSPFDADGASIVIHQNLDTYQTGTKGQGVAGGPGIACGVLTK